MRREEKGGEGKQTRKSKDELIPVVLAREQLLMEYCVTVMPHTA